MIPSRLFYYFSRSLSNIRHQPFVNLITVGVITASFFIFSAFLLMSDNINTLLALWEKDVQIEAYLDDGIDAKGIDEARKAILAIDGVSNAVYIDKEEALERFKKSLGGMKDIVEDLEGNPLPRSFDISLDDEWKDYTAVEKIAGKIGNIGGVTDVVYGREWAERFSTTLAIVRLAGLLVATLLLLATIFIVSNTIRLTVYARKEELEIMKLLGATDRFIRLPFLIEGILQGLVGAGTAVLVLYLAYRFLILKVLSPAGASLVLGSFQLAFLSPTSIAYILLGGMGLGLLGSFVSLGRFLKV